MAHYKFVRGAYSKYVANKSTYDSDGSIFFCTDKPALFANGVGIGCSEELLSEYFEGVKDVAYNETANTLTISYYKTGKADKTITLKGKEYTGKEAVVVSDTNEISLKIDSANKVLSQSADGLTSTLSFKKNEAGQSIQLVGINDAYIAEFSYADFVVDGMLQNVDYNKENPNKLDFVWNTAAGSKTMSIDLSKYIDTYNAGKGLALDSSSKTFSVKLKATGEKYLELTENGELATKDIDKAIGEAVGDVTDALEALTADDIKADDPNNEGGPTAGETTVQDVLDLLNTRIDNVSDDVISVTNGNGISVTGASSQKTIAAVAKNNDKYIDVTADGIGSKAGTKGATAIDDAIAAAIENAFTWYEA